MKHQALFSSKDTSKKIKLLSAAILLGVPYQMLLWTGSVSVAQRDVQCQPRPAQYLSFIQIF